MSDYWNEEVYLIDFWNPYSHLIDCWLEGSIKWLLVGKDFPSFSMFKTFLSCFLCTPDSAFRRIMFGEQVERFVLLAMDLSLCGGQSERDVPRNELEYLPSFLFVAAVDLSHKTWAPFSGCGCAVKVTVRVAFQRSSPTWIDCSIRESTFSSDF